MNRTLQLERLNDDGFVIVPGVVDVKTVSNLINSIELAAQKNTASGRGAETYAMRNLLESVPEVRALAESAMIRGMAEEVLGAGAAVVRSLFFDKTPGANWKVAWHQDLTIAVQAKKETAGFGAWSMKSGTQHVQPPVEILEQMLTVRLHLDDCDAGNGPLQVLPGSHRCGRLAAEQIQLWRERTQAVECLAERGGAVLMRPLLLHASSAAKKPGHRRVIHLEFASETLPNGLKWLGNGF